jgi:hypothetical protein
MSERIADPDLTVACGPVATEGSLLQEQPLTVFYPTVRLLGLRPTARRLGWR